MCCSYFLASIKPCLIFNHPLLHILLSMFWVFHYFRMILKVMRFKCIHPRFECFTFRRYFAKIAFKSFHIFLSPFSLIFITDLLILPNIPLVRPMTSFPNWRCLFENIRTELSGLGRQNSPQPPPFLPPD